VLSAENRRSDMPTLTEFMRQVLANPAGYSFPVGEQVTGDPSFHFPVEYFNPSPLMQGSSVDLAGARLTPEMLDQAREVLRRSAARINNVGPDRDRVYMITTPLRADSVAYHIAEERRLDSENRIRFHEAVMGADAAVWGDGSGESAHRGPRPEMTIIDEVAAAPSHGWALADSPQPDAADEENSTRHNDHIGRPAQSEINRTEARMLLGINATEDDITALCEGLPGTNLPIRPEHCLVDVGLCCCRFSSIFENDMSDHLAETPMNTSSGVRFWKVCDRCHTSALCRRVAVARAPRIRFTENMLDPSGPSAVSSAWHCDNCCRDLDAGWNALRDSQSGEDTTGDR
jgi:hypothetical protein